MADAVAEVKARLDIVEVVGGYVRLQRSGRDWKGLCPFHAERTPSFSVSQEKQAWYCFGCQEGGDVLSFVERIEHVEFLQALEMLAERAGVELERSASGDRQRGQARRRRARALDLSARAQAYYEHILWSTEAGAPGRALLAERGVSEETARAYGVGFAPAGGTAGDALLRYLGARSLGSAAEAAEAGLAHPPDRSGRARDRFRNRLVFPIRDERGDVLGFGGRALGDAVPKYLNSPATAAYDKSLALFGIDRARSAVEAAGCAVIVEGYFDVLAAAAIGLRHTVASSGTALTAAQVRLLARWTRCLVLCFDGDDAGLTASSRAVDVIAAEGLEARICVLPPGCKDPDELVRRDPAALAACVAAAQPEWQVLLDRAIGDAESGSAAARREAQGRAKEVLARIPDATLRDTVYLPQMARRFNLSVDAFKRLDVPIAAVSADLEQLRWDKARASLRMVMRPSSEAEAEVAELHEDGALPRWEEDLGRIVVQQPGLAVRLVEEHGLRVEELTDPTVQHLIEIALADPDSGAFPLHRLAPAERRVAARLHRPVPALREDGDSLELTQFLADIVARVREAPLVIELSAKRTELQLARDAGRSELAERLASEVYELARRLHHVRGRDPGQDGRPIVMLS
jgi:DNA primase catalytic core